MTACAALFFAGAFLCNAIPHLAAGLRGEAFPTPFARPRGVGLSPPLINFLWGSANIGAGLLCGHIGAAPHPLAATIAFAAGWLAIGCYLSIHFGRVRRG